MLHTIVTFLGYLLMGAGAFLMFTGALGVLRMPDFYTRLHPAGVTDSFGAPMVLLGVALLSGWTIFSAKIILLILFLFITNPTATHALAKAAILSGLLPFVREKK